MAQQFSRNAPTRKPRPYSETWCFSACYADMASYADMAVLNKSSGKVATFAVRIVGAKASEYTFTSKRNTSSIMQHKFEAWLIGINAQAYCIGFVKGSQAAVKQA